MDKQTAKLIARIAENLPRDLDDQVMQGWIDNPVSLQRFLSGLCPETSEPMEKFALFADLGIITVPDDYDHATALTSFRKKNYEKFYYYNDNIADHNFPKPTRVLKPGDKLRVCAFKQVVGGSTTSEERMDFLRSQKAVFTGAQGASLVFDQKRDQLPKGRWYTSFDEKERLWQDAGGYHGVPRVDADSGGDFYFCLGLFGSAWCAYFALLCFCDLEFESSGA